MKRTIDITPMLKSIRLNHIYNSLYTSLDDLHQGKLNRVLQHCDNIILATLVAKDTGYKIKDILVALYEEGLVDENYKALYKIT